MAPCDFSPVKRQFLFFLLFLLIGAGGLAFRLPQLCDRPMHADEAVQAAIFRDLWQQGRYTYNPDEFHGPTLTYATLPSAWLGGATTFAETTERTYRIVPVLFGAGVILLVWLLGDALGKPAAICAAVLAAVSPAMVFYSRYFIHETLLVFFTMAAIAAGWRYAQSDKLAWCLAAGACIGLMQATKETAVLAYVAAGIAMGFTWVWGRLWREESPTNLPARPRWHLALGLAAAGLVAVALLSSFFTNPRGPINGVLTYFPWFRRAVGDAYHVHPWCFYLHRAGWWRLGNGPFCSEGLILVLAAAGFVVALIPKSTLLPDASVRFVRWLGFYTIVLTAAYSAIPYKTPWCLLEFLLGMILLAGVGAVALVRVIPTLPLKIVLGVLLLAAGVQLARQSHRASYVLPADPCNPYVYAHTSPGITQLASMLEQLAEASPDGHATPVKVVWSDGYYWPLPWYLRRFEDVKLWTTLPPNADAPVVLSSPQYDAALTGKLDATHLMTGFYEVRPQELVMLWVREDLWKAHLKRLGRL